ncbi:hypothetical protein OBV_32070 [Oscillibacter valericigenes Sjm18-20]|nr:hypothetical protein OBV_32070 [Oscillibacter valericigenes Sjm18-20]
MMNAIVYTSNTGFTAQYAGLLGENLNLPVYSLDAAKKEPAAGAEIIYLGWLMAGQVKGCKQAAERYKIAAVCGVGMGAGGSQIKEVRKSNAISENIPLFTLQGGFELNKLHGIYKFMMNTMKRTVGKKLAAKQDKTADEQDMLDLLLHGGSRVSVENLRPVLEWCGK